MATFSQGIELVSVRSLNLFTNDTYTVPSGFYEEFEVIYYNGVGSVGYGDFFRPIESKLDNNNVFPKFTLSAGESILCSSIGSGASNGLRMTVKRYKNP
jgi:hypothetical protein